MPLAFISSKGALAFDHEMQVQIIPLSGCSDATTPTPATTNKGPFSNVWRGSRILYRTPQTRLSS